MFLSRLKAELQIPVLGLEDPVWMYFVPEEYLTSNREPILNGLWDPRGIEEAIRDPDA